MENEKLYRMKVVCINNGLPISKTIVDRKALTIGKIYEVLDSDILVEFDTGHYEIKNDFNDNKNYNKHLFVTLEQWRNQQLNKLLNE